MQFFAIYNIVLIIHFKREEVSVAKRKRILTAEEKAAKKKHIKEEIQAYVFMFLFIALFVIMFAMFGAQSTLFGR